MIVDTEPIFAALDNPEDVPVKPEIRKRKRSKEEREAESENENFQEREVEEKEAEAETRGEGGDPAYTFAGIHRTRKINWSTPQNPRSLAPVPRPQMHNQL